MNAERGVCTYLQYLCEEMGKDGSHAPMKGSKKEFKEALSCQLVDILKGVVNLLKSQITGNDALVGNLLQREGNCMGGGGGPEFFPGQGKERFLLRG